MNKAYEFLCSKSSKQVQGPDPHNIVLILKAQSILFKRHKDGRVLNLVTLSVTASFTCSSSQTKENVNFCLGNMSKTAKIIVISRNYMLWLSKSL